MKKLFVSFAFMMFASSAFAGTSVTSSSKNSKVEITTEKKQVLAPTRGDCSGTIKINGQEYTYDFGDRSEFGCAWRTAAFILMNSF